MARPRRKATAAERDQVKLLRADGWSKERIARLIGTDHETLSRLFADELEHGADIKRAELLAAANKGAKKGNATLIRWLHDRSETARAAEQLEQRGAPPPAAEEKAPKLGKKEQQQQAANGVRGKYETPAGPSKLH